MTSAPRQESTVYLIGTRLPEGGITELSVGLGLSPGIRAFGWTLCADSQDPRSGWPEGGANRISWDACQPDPAIAGALYIYAYAEGTLAITSLESGPGDAPGSLIDCAGSRIEVAASASVGFSDSLRLKGCNPCRDNCASLCGVWPRRLDAGIVAMGEWTRVRFTVWNNGVHPVVGVATVDCPGFEVVGPTPEGGPVGAFSLGEGEQTEVVVRFQPVLAGLDTCVVDLGFACGGVVVSGRGKGAAVSPRPRWTSAWSRWGGRWWRR